MDDWYHGFATDNISEYNDSLSKSQFQTRLQAVTSQHRKDREKNVTSALSKIKSQPVLTLPENNEKRIVKKFTCEVNKKTKLTIIFSKEIEPFICGDVIFSNHLYSTPIKSKRIFTISDGFSFSFSMSRLPVEFSEFVKQTTSKLLDFAQSFDFQSVAFLNIFSDDYYYCK